MQKEQIFRGPEDVYSEHEFRDVNTQSARPIGCSGTGQMERLQINLRGNVQIF